MIREAKWGDLKEILLLYQQLGNNPIPEEDDKLLSLWESMLADRNRHIIVAEEEEKVASTCLIVIIPNLTHSQRPYALIENVMTDVNFRNRGLATACLNFARDIAAREYCYKIMLMTGSKLDSTLRFYENAGYNRKDKTGFVMWLDK